MGDTEWSSATPLWPPGNATLDDARRLAQTKPERLDVYFVPSLKPGMQADGILIYSDGHEAPMKVAEFLERATALWVNGSAKTLFRKLRKNKIWGGGF
jgi:hypothetical protein